MLAKRNRIVRSDDYKLVVRRGRRTVADHAIVYVRSRSHEPVSRFGFIVAKTVGNAVKRNLVRRRMKSIAATLLPTVKPGSDIVIRGLPGAAQTSWANLSTEITEAISKGMARA